MQPKTKWLIAGLASSVALNLALAGFYIGASTAEAGAQPNIDVGMGVRQALSHLPKERQREVLGSVKEHRAEGRRVLRSLMRELHEQRRHAWSLIGAEDLDEESMLAALREYRSSLAEAQSAMDRWTVELLASLGPNERRNLLKAFRPEGLFARGFEREFRRMRDHRNGPPRQRQPRDDGPPRPDDTEAEP